MLKKKTGAIPLREKLLESLMTEFNRLARTFHAGELRKAPKKGEAALGFVHFKLFSLVADEPDGIAVKELAEVLGVTSSAITQLVDPLVAHRYLTREADTTDRRSIRIKANAKNARHCALFRTTYMKYMGELFTPLSEKELREFIRLIEKVRGAKRTLQT
jgi:DNA-binding MarR family transcriptional regulator